MGDSSGPYQRFSASPAEGRLLWPISASRRRPTDVSLPENDSARIGMTEKTNDGGTERGNERLAHEGDDIGIAGLDGRPCDASIEGARWAGSRVEGRLLRGGDAGWEDAVRIWNGMVAKSPALVLQPTSALDVAEAVRFAGDHGLLLSIKGGGHNMAGTSIADRGMTLDMSRMLTSSSTPTGDSPTLAPGVCSRTSTGRHRRYGLATPLGSFSSEVGVAGRPLEADWATSLAALAGRRTTSRRSRSSLRTGPDRDDRP